MKYLVQKRAELGVNWVAFPGQVVEDPPGADILLNRGFIIPVSAEYTGELSVPRAVAPPAAKPSTDVAPAGAKVSLKDLSYGDLQTKARLLGVKGNQKRSDLEKAIAKAEKEAPAADADGDGTTTVRERLEAFSEDELVKVANEYGVEVTSKDATIDAILAKAGYDNGKSENGDDPHGPEI